MIKNCLDKNIKIYIAGHTWLVGSTFVRQLEKRGYSNLLLSSHSELDLTDQKRVEVFLLKKNLML